jgi:hypothetical protein
MTYDDSKNQALSARAGLKQSADRLRARLTPQSLMHDGVELARERAMKLAATALASRKGRPVLAVGAIAVAASYLLRKPIARAVNKRLAKEKNDD